MSEKFEKAKKGLACCGRRGYCEGHCPYYEPEKEALECTSELAHDALALISHLDERIKELSLMQTARVMTLEEANEADVVWIETLGNVRIIPARINVLDGVAIVFKFIATQEKASLESYGAEWRAWTSRPTEEQRKAVKWE